MARFYEREDKIIHNSFISLSPEETTQGNLKWACESNLERKYLPTDCIISGGSEDVD